MRAVWVLLIGGLLAGCSAPQARVRPIPVPPSGPRFEALVAELLARPVRPPKIAQGEACPVDDSRPRVPSPLYPDQLRLEIVPELPREPDGLYGLKNLWLSAAGSPGPVVVRVAAQLDGDGRGLVRLNNNDALSRGDALVFPVPDWDEDWPSGTYVSGPGCYAYQLDGASFSMTIVFSVKITT